MDVWFSLLASFGCVVVVATNACLLSFVPVLVVRIELRERASGREGSEPVIIFGSLGKRRGTALPGVASGPDVLLEERGTALPGGAS